ncbi:MAG TPA: substrate-binding domain-containing protein [Armatimonadota bacterium]|jgi:ABC-type sugar transport system substrate-binding protein
MPPSSPLRARARTLASLGLAAILVAAAGCRRADETSTTANKGGTPPGAGAPAAYPEIPSKKGQKIKVGMLPKVKGNPYFNACEQGAKEAAAQLGNVELIYDGPNEGGKPDKAIQIIENWTTQKVDVIAISADDPIATSPAMEAARRKGIHVITWDADADPQRSGREFFVNQATEQAIGETLVDLMAQEAGPNAPVAIVTATLTAANQNAWIGWMKKRMASKYPKMTLVTDPKPSEEDRSRAFQVTQDLLKAYPQLKGVWGMSSNAFPGAADAVDQAGKKGQVAVLGLSTPKDMKEFVDKGVVKSVLLWNPLDLGYLTVYAARALADGDLKAGSTEITAGRLGAKKVEKDQVLLGTPMVFNKGNINKFNF